MDADLLRLCCALGTFLIPLAVARACVARIKLRQQAIERLSASSTAPHGAEAEKRTPVPGQVLRPGVTLGH